MNKFRMQFAGHSLGEYAAIACFSNLLTFKIL